MTPRRRLLDGLLAALAFLVLAQGYRLATGTGPDLPILLAASLAVGVTGATLTAAFAAVLRKRRV